MFAGGFRPTHTKLYRPIRSKSDQLKTSVQLNTTESINKRKNTSSTISSNADRNLYRQMFLKNNDDLLFNYTDVNFVDKKET